MIAGSIVMAFLLAQGSSIAQRPLRGEEPTATPGHVLVLDELGMPLARARVSVTARTRHGRRLVARPDVTGTTVLRQPLEEGTYELYVVVGQRRETAVVVVPHDMELVDVRIRLSNGSGIELQMGLQTICITRPAVNLLDFIATPPN